MISIEVSNRQQSLVFDSQPLVRAAEAILRDADVVDGELSIAVLDDPAIHELNRQYLAHDYPTDVLSFVLERDGPRLDGEVIVSAETATRAAAQCGWAPTDELLLYVIHGTLHLVGHDDDAAPQRAAMREAEPPLPALFGLEPREIPTANDSRTAESSGPAH